MSQSPTASPDTDFPKWDPRVIGLVGVICSIFLLFSYYKILERNCVINVLSRNGDQRRRLNHHHLDQELSSQFHSRGLDSCVMHSLPITQIKKSSSIPSESCAVCLGEFEEGEWVKHLPICSHVFHVCCIDTWFQTHSSCPLCRSSLCHINDESSVEMDLYLETLTREDFHRQRLEHYQDESIQVITVESRR